MHVGFNSEVDYILGYQRLSAVENKRDL